VVVLDESDLLVSQQHERVAQWQRSLLRHLRDRPQQRSTCPRRLEEAVVGDQEKIDTDVAEALVSRLHAAGLDLHRTLDLPLSAEARSHIESAIDEIDGALRVIRVAATNFDTPGESGSPT